MNKYVWIFGEGDFFHAGTKALRDCNTILVKAGWKPFYTRYTGNRWRDIWSTFTAALRLLLVPKDSLFVIQFPSVQLGHSYLLCALICWRFKAIALVHDLNVLRDAPGGSIKSISHAAVVIAHTPAMASWLTPRLPRSKIIILEIFDYLHSDEGTAFHQHLGERKIVFAGNLSPAKSGFLYQPFARGRNILLFGAREQREKLSSCYTLCGLFHADRPHFPAECFMGLVWDGPSIETCEGISGNYQRFNSPHKTSLYLSCGLPVMIWSQAAMAPFIVENNCGLAIDSLDEMMDQMETMTDARYQEMCKSAANVGAKLRQGHYTLRAVEIAVRRLA